MRPSRYLAVLAVIFAVLFSLVFFTGKGSLHERLKPKLGLDLVGGTTVTLIAKNQSNGQPPNAAQLEQARQIIENRVNGLGVAEPEVVTEGNSNIVISVAGESSDAIRQVGVPAQLRFRKVINTAEDAPAETASPSPSASASPSTSATSASATASASAKVSASPSASATATPSASTSATAGASATPSASPTVPASVEKQREAVLKKLGTAGALAQQLTAPTDAANYAELLAPFGKLTPEEVAVLTPEMQFNVPQITCEQLNGRPAGSIEQADQPAVSCEQDGHTKYLLDVAKVLGTDVNSASATIDTTAGSSWVVSLSFTGSGQKKWTELTKEAYNNTDSKCVKLGDESHCLVAVVLDNEVVSAPQIQGVITGDAQISGSFTKASASLLASQLKYGALPLTFTAGEARTISATLGTEQLQAGLLAAGIGMLLVIIYAFFYYRLLGSVIFLSLVLSGLLTYGALVLLGRQIGFTLTLAGIAGFIVSLGVAADSFVIYFERLKDEIRDGRSPRSAVPRAWQRARRTIVTANVVSILAATILYLVGVGSVRGFAFALGLATLLDLLVVFLFRHPMMTMLASTKAFLSPRVSGLGRVLQHAGDDAPAKPASRVKEA